MSTPFVGQVGPDGNRYPIGQVPARVPDQPLDRVFGDLDQGEAPLWDEGDHRFEAGIPLARPAQGTVTFAVADSDLLTEADVVLDDSWWGEGSYITTVLEFTPTKSGRVVVPPPTGGLPGEGFIIIYLELYDLDGELPVPDRHATDDDYQDPLISVRLRDGESAWDTALLEAGHRYVLQANTYDPELVGADIDITGIFAALSQLTDNPTAQYGIPFGQFDDGTIGLLLDLAHPQAAATGAFAFATGTGEASGSGAVALSGGVAAGPNSFVMGPSARADQYKSTAFGDSWAKHQDAVTFQLARSHWGGGFAFTPIQSRVATSFEFTGLTGINNFAAYLDMPSEVILDIEWSLVAFKFTSDDANDAIVKRFTARTLIHRLGTVPTILGSAAVTAAAGGTAGTEAWVFDDIAFDPDSHNLKMKMSGTTGLVFWYAVGKAFIFDNFIDRHYGEGIA